MRKRGDQRNENPQDPNAGRRIEPYMPGLHKSREPRTFAVSKVWKYMYWIHAIKQIPLLCMGLNTHAQIRLETGLTSTSLYSFGYYT